MKNARVRRFRLKKFWYINCGTQKAVKLLKELDSEKGIGLIEKKRLGLGRPNVIYVKNFLFQKNDEENGNTADLQNCENHNSGVVKTTIQEFPKSQFKNDENHNSEEVETINTETERLEKEPYLNEEKTAQDSDEVILSYEVTSTDLKNYKKGKDYKAGRKNPFSAVTTTEAGNTTQTNTTGNTNTTNSGSKVNTENTTNTEKNNSTSNSTNYYPDKGIK